MITRRDASKLVLSGTAAAVLPLRLDAQSPQQFAEALEAELNGQLGASCKGRFRVRDFQIERVRGELHMVSVVRLDWPPGVRQRPFHRRGSEARAMYDAMLNEALFRFGRACTA